MGIEGQAARLKKCAGPKRKVDTITSTSGRKTFVVGVDMSCIMMTGVKQKPGAEEYHADPPLPQHHTAKFTFDKVRKYKNANVEVIGVFDGISRTPLKQENAGGSRDDSRDKALQRLQQLLQKPWPATEEEQQKILSLITKKRKASARVNENTIAEVMQLFDDNGIKYVVAPFEADWQLAYMYSQGIIDAIETTDSDFWALLDHPCCLMNMNSSDLKGYLCYSDGCSLIGSNDSIQTRGRSLDKPIHHMTRVGAIIRAAVYGNDYHNGIKGLGEVNLERLITQYKDDEAGLIQHLTNKYQSFGTTYKWIDGIYRNAPVFEMKHDATNSKINFSFTGKIVSHEGNDIESWPDVVGFNPHSLIYKNFDPDCRPTYNSIAMGKWLAAYGKQTALCIVRRDINDVGKELPYGHKLNWKVPPCYQPEMHLMRWLNVRGYQRRPRHNLLRVVNKMRINEDQFKVMTEEEAQILLPKSMRYSGLEVLIPSMKTCDWERKNLNILHKVKGGDKYIHKIFGKRNGVRRRALNRLRNGHFYIDTLKSAKVKSKAKYGNRRKDLYIIQCQCLASMRSNVYTVNLVINKNGDFIKSPYSRCSCAAGNMFCAHMLGLNLLCQVAKKHQNWDRNILQEHLPSHVEQVQRLCIPVSGMWNKKMNTR